MSFLNRVVVTVDFDSTLTRKDVQEYVASLLEAGIEVWVVTSRYDNLCMHLHTEPHSSNQDLFSLVNDLSIPKYKVRFTCGESKSKYLEKTKVLWHLDDDIQEIQDIKNSITCKTKGIWVENEHWKEFCEQIILDSAVNISI